MIRILILFGVSLVPMIVTITVVDEQSKAAQGFNELTVRLSQDVETVPSLVTDGYMETATLRGPISLTPVTPELSSDQLVISRCNGQSGSANFRSSPNMISQNRHMDPNIITVMPRYSRVELTGQKSSQWLGVVYRGMNGWINQCWK